MLRLGEIFDLLKIILYVVKVQMFQISFASNYYGSLQSNDTQKCPSATLKIGPLGCHSTVIQIC